MLIRESVCCGVWCEESVVVGAGDGCGMFFRSGHNVTIEQREYLATSIVSAILMISKD